jgi:hypothetical protein
MTSLIELYLVIGLYATTQRPTSGKKRAGSRPVGDVGNVPGAGCARSVAEALLDPVIAVMRASPLVGPVMNVMAMLPSAPVSGLRFSCHIWILSAYLVCTLGCNFSGGSDFLL